MTPMERVSAAQVELVRVQQESDDVHPSCRSGLLQRVHHRPDVVQRVFVGRTTRPLVAAHLRLEVPVVGFERQPRHDLGPVGLREDHADRWCMATVALFPSLSNAAESGRLKHRAMCRSVALNAYGFSTKRAVPGMVAG